MELVVNVRGDATDPQGEGPRIIAHVCNDVGAWGKGFVVALSRRWPQPEREYRRWYQGRAVNDFGLGAVQFVEVEDDLIVANMVAQHGLRRSRAEPPIRYEALATCLDTVTGRAAEVEASVHMPRIGAGLAGGDWPRIEDMIRRAADRRSVTVTVYELS